MKKILILLIVLSIFNPLLFAQPKLIAPVDPAILGRGNAAIAEPGGYQSFFHNPAGFATDNQFTLLSANPWLFTDVNTIDLLSNPQAAEERINAAMTDPAVTAEIDTWVNDQPYDVLYDILIEAGVSGINNEDDAYNWFNAGMTDDKYMEIAAVLLEIEDFPVQAEDLDLPGGAARAGMSAGLAFTNSGFGLGLFALAEGEFYGPNIFDTTGIATVQATAHVGYAFTFDLGLLKLHAGAQLRPTLIYQTVVGPEFLNSLMAGASGDIFTNIVNRPGIMGFGIGLDAGAIAEIWWLKIGVSAMNALNVMNYNTSITLTDIISNPSLAVPEENELLNPEQNITLNFGIAFHPEIPVITKLIDPTLYIDFHDINGIIEAYQEGNDPALIDLVNIGLDVKLLSFLRAQIGYTEGYFTAGVGIDLPVINISIAGTIGTLDFDDISDFGVAAEIAIRF